MTTITVSVFAGKDNVVELEIKVDGQLVDFTSVNRYLLTLTSSFNTIVIDTDINPGAITGDSNGILTIDIGTIVTSETKDLYSSELCIFDPANLNGLVIFDPCEGTSPHLDINIC